MSKVDSQNIISLTTINRRNFLHLGVSLAIAGTVLVINKIEIQPSLEEKLISLMNVRSSIPVGLAILNSPSIDLPTSNLIAVILESLNLSPSSLLSITHQELLTRFMQQTANDFDSGRVFNTSGWVLSLIEAQLCALAAQKYTHRTKMLN